MKEVVLAGLLLLFLNTFVYSQRVSTTSGNALLESCESKEEFQQAFCSGYVQGATDLDGMEGAAFPERRRSCVGENVTNGQIEDVVVKYLRDHPEERHVLAAILVVKAAAKAFPCKP
jgi:hypothetical protein